MTRGTVIALCNRTEVMVRPWLEAGYDALTVDLQTADITHPLRRHIVSDVTELGSWFATNHGASVVFAFPPCTHLAVSGARWFKEKGMGKLIEALQIVDACREICEGSGAPWMLENPVGTLATYWREPDYTFNPNDYGDPYTKKTCIWAGNGFVMPPKVAPGDMFHEPTWVFPSEGSKMHRMTGKVNGENNFARSITPEGFAKAVFLANAPHLRVSA
jgi:hypothetical protein